MHKFPVPLLALAGGRPRLAVFLAPLAAIVMAFLASGGLPVPLPGVAPPPAAEALGREFRVSGALIKNASDVTDEQLGGAGEAERCQIDLSIKGRANADAGRGIHQDYFCFSYTERAIVTLTATENSIPYRAYLASGQQVAGAQAWHPGVRVEDSRERHLGRGAGVAEYNGVLDDDAASADHTREIVVTRAAAAPASLSNGANLWPPRNGSAAFLIVYGGTAGDTDLSAHTSKVDGSGLADLTVDQDVIIKIYFLHEFDPGVTWLFIPGVEQQQDGSRTSNHWFSGGITPQINSSGNYHPNIPRIVKPSWDRQVRLNDYWLTADGGDEDNTGIKYCIQPRDYANGGYYHPEAETKVSLTFARGSNLSGASGSYSATIPNSHWAAAAGGCRPFGYLSGFNPAGPVRAEWRFTFDDGQGTTHPIEPITLIIEGPPAHLYLTRAPTTRLSGGTRYVQMRYALTDALGTALTGSRARITWRGADERSRAAIARSGGGGSAGGGRLNFPIAADAAAGSYRLTLTAGGISRDVAFTVPPLPTPAAEIVPASITADALGGGTFTAGGRANFRYTLQDRNGNPISLTAHPVTWSTTASGVIDQAGNVDGARQNDGRFGFDIASNPAPGEYTITIRTVATGADGSPLATRTITFRILGNPARYAVAGPDQVAPGGYAVYKVTAADANGNLPNLAGAHGRVAISVSRAGSDADAGAAGAAEGVRLFHIDDGSLTLNRAGVGYFRLRADRDAAAGRITITASSADGTATGSHTLAIGAAPQQ